MKNIEISKIQTILWLQLFIMCSTLISQLITVGSNMILMVVSNAVRARYIVRIRKLTVKPYVRDSKLVSKALPILAHVRELDLTTDKLSVLT